MTNDDGAGSEKSVKNKGGQIMAEKKESMTGKFLIEDDWYLIADENSWNIARKTGREKKMFTDMTYHRTPEQALEYYLRKRQSEACRRVSQGDLRTLVETLSSEHERLSATLRAAFANVCDFMTDKDNDRN